MADLNEIEQDIAQDDELADIPIFRKNGKPYLAPDGSQATIGVYGSESKLARAASDKQQRAMIRRQKTKLTVKDIRDARIEYVVACVGRWHGWTANGQEFRCDPKNVEALLQKDHILRQVEQGIDEHADFFEPASES